MANQVDDDETEDQVDGSPDGADDDQGETVDLDSDTPDDVEDTDDGGAMVTVGEEEAPADSEHFENLAEKMSEADLFEISSTLLDLIEDDKKSRELRDKQYEEGIRRTGLGNDAPGGAEFEGASKVVHPLLTEVCVDFAARAMKELCPPGGPVKDFIPGKVTAQKLEKAKRKTKWMNYQITKVMPEFRSELEQLLTQVPLGGAQYLKLYWDHKKRRPVPKWIPIDDYYLPYAASNSRSSQRATHVQRLTDFEYRQKVKAGEWRDVDLIAPDVPEQSASEEANDQVEGRSESSDNPDGLRIFYEVQCMLDIEVEGEDKPYLVTIDEETRNVVAIYRNWAEEDEDEEPLQHVVEFPFVPWRGAYPIGIIHMIGGLSAAATGALRALLDSAHINNMPTALKLAGGASGGQTVELNPTEIREVQGSFDQDDIRKVIMPMPFNPPSPVLYQLLGFLVDAGKGVVQTTFEDLADQRQDMPVGTTLALIEQGMTVFNAIHARLHNAMEQVLSILHRLNATFLADDSVVDDTGEVMVRRKDFQGAMDVVPVSDPNIFSETQRFAQVQAIAARAAGNPLYDQRKVEELILERLKLPNAKDLLVPKQEPHHLNAVNENMASMLGRPVIAFPEQEHVSHIVTHVMFLLHPLYGQNPLVQGKVYMTLLPHLAEHLAFLYVTNVFEISSKAAGMDVSTLIDTKDPDVVQEFDKLMVGASQAALAQISQMPQLQNLLQVIQQGMQIMQSNQPPMPMDPSAVQAQEVQRKAKADDQNAQLKAQQLQLDQAKLAQDQQRDAANMQQKQKYEDGRLTIEQQREQREAAQGAQSAALAHQTAMADLQTRSHIAAGQQDTQKQIAAVKAQTDAHISAQDNLTALTISREKIAHDQTTNLKDGRGINPGNEE
jgi:hypothetical protein